jgi:hypothetical protein
MALSAGDSVVELNRFKRDRVIDPKVPVYANSPTGQAVTKTYHDYHDYHDYYDSEAQAFGELFYRDRSLETDVKATLSTYGLEPAIYISTSNMLDHAAAPQHLLKLAYAYIAYRQSGLLG